jgi:hypothetical protein
MRDLFQSLLNYSFIASVGKTNNKSRIAYAELANRYETLYVAIQLWGKGALMVNLSLAENRTRA